MSIHHPTRGGTSADANALVRWSSTEFATATVVAPLTGWYRIRLVAEVSGGEFGLPPGVPGLPWPYALRVAEGPAAFPDDPEFDEWAGGSVSGRCP